MVYKQAEPLHHPPAGPGLTIIDPHGAEVTCMGLHDLAMRLQAHLVDLSAYGRNFACGDGTWAVIGAIS